MNNISAVNRFERSKSLVYEILKSDQYGWGNSIMNDEVTYLAMVIGEMLSADDTMEIGLH